jgi:hypothetical protein
MLVVFEDRIADGNAFVTNVGARVVRRGGNELPDYILALVAERAAQRVVRASALHRGLLVIMQILMDS